MATNGIGHLNIVSIHPVDERPGKSGMCGDSEVRKSIPPALLNVRDSHGKLGFEIVFKQAEVLLPDLLKI